MRVARLVYLLYVYPAAGLELTGRVCDPTGTPIAGAQITADRFGTSTGADGRFRISGIARGKHMLVAKAEGFASVTQSIDVPMAEVEIRLRLPDVQTSLTVTAEADLDSSPAPLTIDSVTLSTLPAPGNDALAALGEWLGPLPGGAGGMSIIVDGLGSSATKLSPERIAEVRINANPYSAEFRRPGSSRIEIRTNTGSERWRGRVSSQYGDSRLNARPAFAARKPVEKETGWDATVSGPVGWGATLLVGAEVDREREQAIVFARTLHGDLRMLVPSIATEWEGRVVLMRAPLTIRYATGIERSVNSGAGGFRLPETALDSVEREHDLQIGVEKIAGGWLIETQIRVDRVSEAVSSRTPDAPRIVVDDAFTAGGAQADQSRQSWSGRLSHVQSRQLRSHTLRVGVQLPSFRRVTLVDRTSRFGTWRFASLAQFELGAPYSLSMRRGQDSLAYGTSGFGMFTQDEWRIHSRVALSLGLRYDLSNTTDARGCFGPRAGLAWRLSRSLVLRAGGGLFFDFIGDQTWRDTLRFTEEGGLREVLVRNPPYPLPSSFTFAEQPPNIVRLDSGLNAARVWQNSIRLEHRFVAVGWTRVRGDRLFGSVDSNAPVPGELFRPRPGFGQIRTVRSLGKLSSDALEAELKLPLLRIQGRAGRILSDTEGESFLPANAYSPEAEWGTDSADRRWMVQAVSTLKIPAALRIGAIWRAQSGAPYTLRTGHDDNFDGVANDRPAGGRRNSLRGAAEFTLNLRIGREFRAGSDHRSIEVAATGSNVLNRANLTGFVGNMSSSLFGQATGARPPRRVDLSLIVRF